jgi:hypothetical protein
VSEIDFSLFRINSLQKSVVLSKLLIVSHLYNYKFFSPTHCSSVPETPNGYKMVVCGGGLLSLPAQKARYFTDLLLNFVPIILGREWFDNECAKPRGQRHPAMEMRYRAMT